MDRCPCRGDTPALHRSPGHPAVLHCQPRVEKRLRLDQPALGRMDARLPEIAARRRGHDVDRGHVGCGDSQALSALLVRLGRCTRSRRHVRGLIPVSRCRRALFNNFISMKAGAFKSSVFELATAEGVKIDDVLVSDASRRTTTLNAYVSGLGDTRRVVVYDNLLSELTPDQARVVIAHELAHAKHNDVLLGTSLGAVGGVAGIALLALLLDGQRLRARAGISGPADPKAVALVLALVAAGTFLISPVENSISRAIEARADRDSIEVTGQGDVFEEMQYELAVHSLNDPTPFRVSQFWFGSHPTVLQRVGMPSSLREAAK